MRYIPLNDCQTTGLHQSCPRHGLEFTIAYYIYYSYLLNTLQKENMIRPVLYLPRRLLPLLKKYFPSHGHAVHLPLFRLLPTRSIKDSPSNILEHHRHFNLPMSPFNTLKTTYPINYTQTLIIHSGAHNGKD